MTPRNSAQNPSARGLWIAFFGPDGVGKSAVIEQLKDQLGQAFSGTTQFHFRPMYRSHGIDRPPVTNPHGRPPRTAWVSLGKLIYWLADCWWGYLFAIRPGVRRSRLVIFDRYYPDVVVDPRRYRLPAGMGFAPWLTTLAPRPDLCILLDAPAEVVHDRKQEVSLAESRRQRIAYLQMFRSRAGALIVNADCPIPEVARRVSVAISHLLTNSPLERREALLIANL